MKTSANADPTALSLDLLVATLDGAPRTPALWSPAPDPPAELDGVLGSWWTEGEEMILSLRGGRFQAELRDGAPGRTVSFFEPTAADRWRIVEDIRRRFLGSRIGELYYSVYRWL